MDSSEEWYFKSAVAGYAIGQCNLGNCYQLGEGIEKDETKAFKWYLISAAVGCTLSSF
ncbi:hypothetical protein C1645_811090 [Glomus cerebriforme]|uniref:Uncharacterized protein n=1 Tax=Glomus cerebriforme TaxID=658196 RepID=A0A397TP85_9GLOM|nr:hypothetical protein C1645_811090 [Glomus cerebriforme]